MHFLAGVKVSIGQHSGLQTNPQWAHTVVADAVCSHCVPAEATVSVGQHDDMHV